MAGRTRQRYRNSFDPLLLEINQLAAHWHTQMLRLEMDLNGCYSSVLHDAENTEESLDSLWLRRRRQLAGADSERFKDEIGAQTESVFETQLHIEPR